MSKPTERHQVSDGNATNTKSTRKSYEQKRGTKASTMDDDSDGFEDDDVLSDDYDEEIINGDEDDEEVIQTQPQEQKPRVWRPGIDKLEEGEVLDYDPASYQVYETATTEWPSLSFDILRNPNLSSTSIKYPAEIFVVCGTQADKAGNNAVNVLYMENINESKNQVGDDDDDGAIVIDDGVVNDDDDDDDNAKKTASNEPVLTSQSFFHPGGTINRIRSMPQQQSIISTWGENGSVYIWNIAKQVAYLSRNLLTPPSPTVEPIYQFNH